MQQDDSLLESLEFDTISPDDPHGLESFLRERRWIQPHETVLAVASAGDGNMNCTLRATIGGHRAESRSIVVKQSRPWVTKYPSIAAPVERTLSESRFYECVSGTSTVASAMPRLLGHDPPSFSLCLEDLADSTDMTDAYGQATLPLEEAATWLGQLHTISIESIDPESLANLELRRLNRDHVFVIPLGDQLPIDLDAITTGLESCRQELCRDDRLKRTAKLLAEQYVDPDSWKAPNARLLHGDYYPGSFLRKKSRSDEPLDQREQFFVIDPEFCFVGPAEFDLGVLLAHSIFCGHSQSDAAQLIRSGYGSSDSIDARLWQSYAGMEIIRRLLGVAQLPLDADLNQKREWIAIACEWLAEG